MSRLDAAVAAVEKDTVEVYSPPAERAAVASEDWAAMSEEERLRYSGFAAWRNGPIPRPERGTTGPGGH